MLFAARFEQESGGDWLGVSPVASLCQATHEASTSTR